MIALFGALAAAVAAVTALHLRSRPRGGASPYPSFQHLEGLAPRTRPAWPLEEPLRWTLRVLALCLAAGALFLSRREERRPLVLLVEPGSPSWENARGVVDAANASSRATIAMTFEGGLPVVEVSPRALEAAGRAKRSLSSCSATCQACLVRAARAITGDALVVSSFREPGDTFAPLGGFRYLRTAPPGAEASVKSEAPKAGRTHVVRLGKSMAARIWAAVLETVESEMGSGETEIVVVDRVEDGAGGGFALVPVVKDGALGRTGKVGSVALGEDASFAAGIPALALESSLVLRPDASARALVAPVLAARGRAILAAATEEDLGSWAHSSTLSSLAKIVLFESGRSLDVREVVAGSHEWISASGEKTPVGILDVAPGRYERDDHRVHLDVARTPALSGAPTDADLAAIGGRRVDALPADAAPSRWPFALLAAALALRLVDLPVLRSRVGILFSLAVLALLLLTIDASIVHRFTPDTEAPRAVVLPEGRPRVQIASWELPAETRVGEAGLLRATLIVTGAQGRDVKLVARPTSGPTAEVSRRIVASSEAVTLSLPVSAAAEGISFALVAAAVGEQGDAVVVPLVTRTHQGRRVVLAAAPSWEARAAGEALAKRGAVERITRLGSKAVLRRESAPVVTKAPQAPNAPKDPLDLLAGDLSKTDLVVLCAFTREDLAGATEASLARYVREGGALLFLGGVPRLSSLPVPVTSEGAGEAGLPSRVTGTSAGRTLAFSGFPAWKSTLPSAGVVLGRLDGAPWIVGRAVGLGRIAAIIAPDSWRAGAAGSGGGYEALLGGVVAWLEAGRAGAPVLLSRDLRALEVSGTSIPLPAESVSGLPVDPVDPFALLPPGPAKERVLARRAGVPFLTATSETELSDLRARIPPPAPLPRGLYAREFDAIWLALCALLVFEVALRRRAA